MKYFILLICLSFFSVSSFSQDLPPNPEPGNCYARCVEKDGKLSSWQVVDCELLEVAKDSVKLRTLQIKMNNYSYQVPITGKINNETIAAFKSFLKQEKKRFRKAKRKR